VLSYGGYEVLEAESANDVFDILKREPVDLIVLDIKLRFERTRGAPKNSK
jgi:DNA-binding response OmpR family regulator